MMCSESNFTICDINIDFLEVLIRWPSVPKCMANVEMDGLKGYSLVLNKRYYVKKTQRNSKWYAIFFAVLL